MIAELDENLDENIFESLNKKMKLTSNKIEENFKSTLNREKQIEENLSEKRNEKRIKIQKKDSSLIKETLENKHLDEKEQELKILRLSKSIKTEEEYLNKDFITQKESENLKLYEFISLKELEEENLKHLHAIENEKNMKNNSYIFLFENEFQTIKEEHKKKIIFRKKQNESQIQERKMEEHLNIISRESVRKEKEIKEFFHINEEPKNNFEEANEERNSFESSAILTNPFDQNKDIYQKKKKEENLLILKEKKINNKINNDYSSLINKELFEILQPFYNKEYFKNKFKIIVSNTFEKEPQTSILKLSQYYKHERLEMKKQTIEKNLFNSTNFNYICKYIEEKNAIIFYQLEENKDLNKNEKKVIEIEKNIKLAPSICYNENNSRIYAFNNLTTEIYVYSMTNLEFVCKIKVNRKIINPLLYNYYINGGEYLFLIGGYVNITSEIVEGSKMIDIYELNKWSINLKPNVIKLSIGRISPIVIFEKKKIIIIGGNSMAKLEKCSKLNYSFYQELNKSTNLTGVALHSEHILNEEKSLLSVFNSLPVEIDKDELLKLHSAFLLSQMSSKMLILPKEQKLYQVRITEKYIQITIPKYEPMILSTDEKYEHSEINCSYGIDLKLIKINKEGTLNIIKIIHKQKTIEKTICEIY